MFWVEPGIDKTLEDGFTRASNYLYLEDSRPMKFGPVRDGLVNVYRSFVREALSEYPAYFEFALSDTDNWSEETWKTRANMAYVATSGETYLGIISLRQDTGYSTHVGEIKFMYVPPRLQGNGLGTQILTRLEEEAQGRGIEQLFLSVVRPNPAFGLYDKLGYVVYGHEADIRRVDGVRYGRYLMSKVL